MTNIKRLAAAGALLVASVLPAGSALADHVTFPVPAPFEQGHPGCEGVEHAGSQGGQVADETEPLCEWNPANANPPGRGPILK